MAYNPQYGLRSCFSRPNLAGLVHENRELHPGPPPIYGARRTCWIVTSLERRTWWIPILKDLRFTLIKFDPGDRRPEPIIFLQCRNVLITRTYSLASSLQSSGIRIHNHFRDACGAQWKRKGLRVAIISNTHRITWIYIWIISVLCKMNHKNHTKHNAHDIRIHV